MRKLNQETKDALRANVDRHLDTTDTSLPPEGRAVMLHSWIIGLLEHVDTYEKEWFEPVTESNRKLTTAKKVMYDR